MTVAFSLHIKMYIAPALLFAMPFFGSGDLIHVVYFPCEGMAFKNVFNLSGIFSVDQGLA